MHRDEMGIEIAICIQEMRYILQAPADSLEQPALLLVLIKGLVRVQNMDK